VGSVSDTEKVSFHFRDLTVWTSNKMQQVVEANKRVGEGRRWWSTVESNMHNKSEVLAHCRSSG